MENSTNRLLEKYIITKDINIRNKIVEQNLYLIEYVYDLAFKNSSNFKEDILSYGVIGLINAVKKYDRLKCPSFSTFAVTCIYHQMMYSMYQIHGFGSNGIVCALEEIKNNTLIEDNETYDEIVEPIVKNYYRKLDKGLNIKCDDISDRPYYESVNNIVKFLLRPTSIDDIKNKEEISETSNNFYVIDDIIDADYDNMLESSIVEVLFTLMNEDEKKVFRLKYGIGCEPMSRIEIMNECNIDFMELRRIENRVIKRFENSINRKFFNEQQKVYLKRNYKLCKR